MYGQDYSNGETSYRGVGYLVDPVAATETRGTQEFS